MELLELRLLHEGPGIDKYAYIYIYIYGSFRKLGVPYYGVLLQVLIIRILLFRVLY